MQPQIAHQRYLTIVNGFDLLNRSPLVEGTCARAGVTKFPQCGRGGGILGATGRVGSPRLSLRSAANASVISASSAAWIAVRTAVRKKSSLKVTSASASFFGCTGRGCNRVRPSSPSQADTVLSCTSTDQRRATSARRSAHRQRTTLCTAGCQSALNSFQITASKSFHLVRLLSAVSDAA